MAAKSTATPKTKKTTTKATKAPAKATARKATAKAPAKRTTAAKKSAPKKSATSKATPVQSFRLTKSDQSFFATRITMQTVYWSILSIAILLLALWILNVQLDIIELLDSIVANQQEI